jgi:hypothetical protein
MKYMKQRKSSGKQPPAAALVEKADASDESGSEAGSKSSCSEDSAGCAEEGDEDLSDAETLQCEAAQEQGSHGREDGLHKAQCEAARGQCGCGKGEGLSASRDEPQERGSSGTEKELNALQCAARKREEGPPWCNGEGVRTSAQGGSSSGRCSSSRALQRLSSMGSAEVAAVKDARSGFHFAAAASDLQAAPLCPKLRLQVCGNRVLAVETFHDKKHEIPVQWEPACICT